MSFEGGEVRTIVVVLERSKIAALHCRRSKTEPAYTITEPEGKHYSHLIACREKGLTVFNNEWEWV